MKKSNASKWFGYCLVLGCLASEIVSDFISDFNNEGNELNIYEENRLLKAALKTELVSKIEEKLPTFLQQGFESAERILELERKAAENNVRGGSNIMRNEMRFHFGKTEAAAKEASACRGLGMLETSRLIVESMKVPANMAHDLLKVVKIPEKFRRIVSANCDNMRTELQRQVACSSTTPYRSIDGSCNNLNRPLDGASMTPYRRYLRPAYEDGVNSPRGFRRPRETALPNPRLVSEILTTAQVPSQIPFLTQMVKTWGQFIDHDMVSTAAGVAPTTNNNGVPVPMSCCNDGISGTSTFPDCLPINVTVSVFYRSVGVRCLRFVRDLPADSGWNLSTREQINQATSYIDASQIYGPNAAAANKLKNFNGRLNENTEGEDGTCASSQCNFPFLPEEGSGSKTTFIAGDIRVTEQPSLTSMHTIWLRYHNLLAEEIAIIHNDWNSNLIYEEVRRIIGALIQQITYNEFLPILLGRSGMNKHKIGLLASGEVHRYNSSLRGTIANVFPAVVFRVGHTLVGDLLQGETSFLPLSNAFGNFRITKSPGFFPSNLLNGECTLPLEARDAFIVESLRNKLFAAGPTFNSGSDLFSINIARGRDHGIPGYNAWRVACGKKRYVTFEEMDEIRPEVIPAFKEIYKSPDDIDLYPAGLAEKPIADGILGDTFACVMGRSFFDLKFSDRFWFENSEQPHPFTNDQHNAIRTTTLASILCDTTSISTIQPFPMFSSVNIVGNEPVSCSTIQQFSILNAISKFW